jgi:hypothetical protein
MNYTLDDPEMIGLRMGYKFWITKYLDILLLIEE